MNLFGFFVRLTHHRDMRKWESATAVFTGKCEKATIRTKMGPRAAITTHMRLYMTQMVQSGTGGMCFILSMIRTRSLLREER